MKELSKSMARRISDIRFPTRYLKGKGIDIGGKPDPLYLYKHMLPLLDSCEVWDLENGDAQLMSSVEDEFFDFVHSSHTLEHLENPSQGLENWIRIVKPGGYLIITVPDEDLYEQGNFENKFNRHHKHTFTIYKNSSWSKDSINILDLCSKFADHIELKKVELIDHFYNFEIPRFDQTRAPNTESAIEIILFKKKIRLADDTEIEEREWDEKLLPHFLQYEKDQRAASLAFPYPFGETK